MNTGDVHFDHLVKVVSAKSLHCRATFFFPFYILFFGSKSLSLMLREGEVKLHLLVGGPYVVYYSKYFCLEDLSLLLPPDALN